MQRNNMLDKNARLNRLMNDLDLIVEQLNLEIKHNSEEKIEDIQDWISLKSELIKALHIKILKCEKLIYLSGINDIALRIEKLEKYSEAYYILLRFNMAFEWLNGRSLPLTYKKLLRYPGDIHFILDKEVLLNEHLGALLDYLNHLINKESTFEVIAYLDIIIEKYQSNKKSWILASEFIPLPGAELNLALGILSIITTTGNLMMQKNIFPRITFESLSWVEQSIYQSLVEVDSTSTKLIDRNAELKLIKRWNIEDLVIMKWMVDIEGYWKTTATTKFQSSSDNLKKYLDENCIIDQIQKTRNAETMLKESRVANKFSSGRGFYPNRLNDMIAQVFLIQVGKSSEDICNLDMIKIQHYMQSINEVMYEFMAKKFPAYQNDYFSIAIVINGFLQSFLWFIQLQLNMNQVDLKLIDCFSRQFKSVMNPLHHDLYQPVADSIFLKNIAIFIKKLKIIVEKQNPKDGQAVVERLQDLFQLCYRNKYFLPCESPTNIDPYATDDAASGDDLHALEILPACNENSNVKDFTKQRMVIANNWLFSVLYQTYKRDELPNRLRECLPVKLENNQQYRVNDLVVLMFSSDRSTKQEVKKAENLNTANTHFKK